MSSLLNHDKPLRVWQRKGALVERADDPACKKPEFTNKIVLKGRDEKAA